MAGSGEPIRIDHDGMSRLVWPCSVPGCTEHCDPDTDVTLLCVAHVAMVPVSYFEELDAVSQETLWPVRYRISLYQGLIDDIVAYAGKVDAVINGDGLEP